MKRENELNLQQEQRMHCNIKHLLIPAVLCQYKLIVVIQNELFEDGRGFRNCFSLHFFFDI